MAAEDDMTRHHPVSILTFSCSAYFSLSLCSSLFMSESSISESLSLLAYADPYMPPCLPGESELCKLLLRPERRRKATALFMRSLPLRSVRVRLDGVAGASFTGLLSAPESEERERPCTVISVGTEGDVKA